VKTDELVGLLARNAEPVRARDPSARVGTAMLAGMAVAAALTIAVLGLNPKLSHELALPMFWVKVSFAAGVGLIGLLAVRRLVRPGSALGGLRAALALPVLAIWLLAGVTLLAAPPADRPALVLGETWRVCTLNIAWLSVPVFAAVALAVRAFAPTRLRLAGAAAGFAAGGVAALVYTLHCPELSAAFIGIWYVLGVLVPTAIGALAGPRLFAW
jgi:hypothetical protein